jgi:CBS domain-containing protein
VSIADVMSTRLVHVEPGATALEAIRRMAEAEVGSVAVCDGSRLVGIFTERDVLRLAGEAAALDGVRVADAMTRQVITVSADTDLVSAARLMGERRIRHLPVVEGDNLLGMIGIRDVLAALAERLWRSRDEHVHETVHELLTRRR